MKVVWGSALERTNNYIAYEKKEREKDAGGNALSLLSNKDTLMAQRNEAKLRAAEDKLLEEYRNRILEIQGSDDDDKTKSIKIEIVNEKIVQIEENRAERERAKIEKELEKQKAEAEKKKQAAEKNRSYGKADDEAGNGITREDIEGMVDISVSHEALKELSRTKAMLKSEAKQLEIDLSNDFGVTKYGRVSTTHATQGDFKHRHLAKLQTGVSKLDNEMAAEVRRLSRKVSETVERRAERARMSETDTVEEAANNETGMPEQTGKPEQTGMPEQTGGADNSGNENDDIDISI